MRWLPLLLLWGCYPTGPTRSGTGSPTTWIDTGTATEIDTGLVDTADRRSPRSADPPIRGDGCSCYGSGGTLAVVFLPLVGAFRRRRGPR